MTKCDDDQPITLELDRGSDLFQEINVRDDDGNPINMTGWSLSILESDPWIATNATVAWTNQINGDAVIRAEWTSLTPAECWARIRFTRTSDNLDDAWPLLKIVWS